MTKHWLFSVAGLVCLLMLLNGHSALSADKPGPSTLTAEEAIATIRTVAEGVGQVEMLTEDLGHHRYQVRQQATLSLIKLSIVSTVGLRPLADDPDPEVATRAEFVLERSRASNERLREAIDYVRQYKIQGLTDELLATHSATNGTWETTLLTETLLATVRIEDAPSLISHFEQTRGPERSLMVTVMGKLAGDERIDTALSTASRDPDEQMQLALACGLASRRDTECLAIFIELLESKHSPTRTVAATSLQKLTGENFGFFHSQKLSHRSMVQQKWREWYEGLPEDYQPKPLRGRIRTHNPFQ